MQNNQFKTDKPQSFGFLTIGICRKEEYGEKDNQQISQILEEFASKHVEMYDGKKWDWSSEGGTFGFSDTILMTRAAEEILFNFDSEMCEKNVKEFSLMICLHFGSCIWNENTQLIHGSEYSWIVQAKNTIGVSNAIVITSDVYQFINQDQQKKFHFNKKIERIGDGKRLNIYIYDPLSISNLLNIAKKYYEKKEKLGRLSNEYNLTVNQIELLLKTAEMKKIVIKETRVEAPRKYYCENEIKNKFNHLKKIKVIDYRGPYIQEEIAKAAANEARKLDIKEGDSIAISCGTTVMEFARNLEVNPGNISGVKIYPLLITMSAEMEEVSPAGIVSYLVKVLPYSKGYAAQFPKEELNEIEAKKRKNDYLKYCDFLIKGAIGAKYLFTGIGQIGEEGVTHSFNRLIKKLKLLDVLKNDLNAVGEYCYQPFTINGELLIEKKEIDLLSSNIIYVDFKKLQEKMLKEKIEIFAIAGGKEKHKATIGALKAKLFNNLVTDIETAEYIINNTDN